MESLKEQFDSHLMELRKTVEENRHMSSFSHIFNSPNFQAIVALGQEEKSSSFVKKMLFEDLLQKNSWEVVWLLSAILEYNPESESVGIFQLLNFPKMCQDLIGLGRNLGFID